jgi:hypothetical protein
VRDVNVRVAAFQTSVANEPIEVRVLDVYVQTADGNEFIAEARDVEAVRIAVSVCEFTPEVMPLVCVSVCALTFVVSFAVAVFTSAVVARVPELKPAPVKVRAPNDQIAVGVVPVFVESWRPVVPAVMRVEVATFQTSAASVPKFESVLVVLAQTAVGMVAKSEVEAVRTVASVCALMFVATVSV